MLPIKLELPEHFLDEEVRFGYKVTEKMKRVWAVELDLLNEFDAVCRKHGLRYFADSGTLLGAIRHKGFIPWDNDVDVVMFRDDYDKLIRQYSCEFQKPYFLQSAYTDVGYYRGHAQLRNSETTGMLPGEAITAKFNQGIFLDIFPFDYHKDSEIRRRLRYYQVKLYYKVFGCLMNADIKKNFKHIVMKAIGRIARAVGPETVYEHFESICRNTGHTTRFVDKISFRTNYKKYRYFMDSWFENAIDYDFEFIRVPIPAGYTDVLKGYYGDDYMTPKNYPSMHDLGGKLILDPEMTYTEKQRQLKEKSVSQGLD